MATEILKSLHSVNEEMRAISKNQQGHNYKFRGIDQVFNVLAPLFKKHGVLVSRRNLETERIVRQVVGKYGPKDYIETFIKRCDYVFTSTKDGSEFITQGFGEGQDSSGGDKSASMATSNAYKYVIFEMFSIATEEQKDSDQVTAEQAAKEKEMAEKAKNSPKNPTPLNTSPTSRPPQNSPPPKVQGNGSRPPAGNGKAPQGNGQGKAPVDNAINHNFIFAEIKRLTDNFNNQERIKVLYKDLGVQNSKGIFGQKNPVVLGEWFHYLKELK